MGPPSHSFLPLLLALIDVAEASRSEPIPIYMDNMLNAGRLVYDRHSPPVQEQDSPTNVKLAMYIEGMSSFRTQTMDFQLDVYFQQYWKDQRLAHNETRRVLVRDQALLDKMWHPDVYFANARIAEFHEVTQPNFLVWIQPDGSILYDTRISLVVLCTLNLEKWPLDSQKCNLRILSYAYDTDQLQIEWNETDPITRNPGIGMSDMHIIDLFPGFCDGNYSTGVWSCVTAEFHVKREITHHVMQSYVPTTLIVVISWFSFWLDVEAVPARVSLAITTLLTLSTQASAARMALPEVSYMKAIDVWMGACMMFVFGVMIEFTIVNYAQRQVLASSMEAVDKEEKGEAKASVSSRARSLLGRLRGAGEQHKELVEEMTPLPLRFPRPAPSPMAESSFDEDEDEAESETTTEPRRPRTAERLAHWEELPSTGRPNVWSRMGGNGTNYGSVTTVAEEKKEEKATSAVARAVGRLKADRWGAAIRKMQKNKKEAGRNRAKRIDQTSRWMFPLMFAIFNLTYWVYYIWWKS